MEIEGEEEEEDSSLAVDVQGETFHFNAVTKTEEPQKSTLTEVAGRASRYSQLEEERDEEEVNEE